jgi:hypothetical protein
LSGCDIVSQVFNDGEFGIELLCLQLLLLQSHIVRWLASIVLSKPLSGNQLCLLLRQLYKVDDCGDDAGGIGDKPAPGPLVSHPFDIHVVQKVNFGQDNKVVQDPIEKECNSWNQSEDQLMHRRLVSLIKDLTDLFVLYQRLEKPEKLTSICHVNYENENI